MAKIFQWNNENERKDIIEANIISYIEDRVKFCHRGDVLITLGFVDPLDFWVKGIIECSCGKKLISFIGDTEGTKLECTGLAKSRRK